MREWSLQCSNAEGKADPLTLTLAADMRLCKPDYLNDHIWELAIGGGEPASLSVSTTYGLRARGMRLFYRFGEAGKIVTNPDEFQRQPRLRRFYPNFLLLDFVPLDGLDVTAEYWTPESHVLAGRLTITNHSPSDRLIDFDLCGALTPLDGQPLGFTQQQMINVLAGRTGDLAPVVFMTAGPKFGAGPHPSLAIKLDFDPGMTRTLSWAVAAEASVEASFELARQAAARAWDAERARIELVNEADMLDIRTGDADWDAALAFSQASALGLFYPGSVGARRDDSSSKSGSLFAVPLLPNPSFVRSRQPDGGYSHSGTGLDHPPGWSGQSPFDAYYLASLLPAARHLTRGLIENYLSVQTEDGVIDAKPGLAGQRAKFLAAPLLSSLAWNYYQETQDDAFLAEVFPKLLAYFKAWFSPAHDRDADGIPEWEHVLQIGFEDHPLFDVWHPWSQGLSISAVFNPELESLLYREATSLILMTEKLYAQASEVSPSLGASEVSAISELLGLLHQHAALLRTSVDKAWNGRSAMYCYRDRLTGQCLTGKPVGRHKGSGELHLRKAEFKQAVRLLIEVQTKNPTAQRPVIEITGLGAGDVSNEQAEGRSISLIDDESNRLMEQIEEAQFQWRSGGLVAISQKVYTKVSKITISGLEEKDQVIVRSVDTTGQDITLFTPLWAHLPNEERAQAIVTRSLLDAERFDRPFGIRALASLPDAEAESVAMSIHMPWNHLIGEGLLAYGLRAEAARLTSHLMQAVIQCLKQNRAFYERYHSETASGIGERGALTGFAPVGLFLQTLGVDIISPRRVRLEGKNPFEWPVTILYKGLKVVRGLETTEVVFPNGQVTTVSDTAPCVVSL